MVQKTFRSMEEFARACGVSRPTAAKYFNDPQDVKPATRARIEAVLKTSEFEPNSFVRHLSSKIARNVGIIVPTIYDPFFAKLVSDLESALRARNFWPIQISCQTRPDLEEEAAQRMLDFKVAGVVVAPLGNLSRPGVFDQLKASIPTVSFDVPLGDDVPFVSNDHSEGMAAMVQYLCRSGEPPVLIEGPHLTDNVLIRQESYRRTMQAEGCEPIVVDFSAEASWDMERLGREQMMRLLKEGLPGKTLLCSNDRIAFGVISAACDAGLRIGRDSGDDIRIAGHDDHPLSRYIWPPLTTTAQDTEAIAQETVQQLLDLLSADASGRDVAPARMRVRSTLMMRKSA
ncbi:LacI family DNA-binding transcriptional regulator [Palleronia sp. LCG004]|uniref:LacI family DNA-binding transcriptional regulator n=1 Tax=Palleronia sp. LCG004 TaxID=3079304 RepID=UPI0029438C3D|nr:LacI family DNA-binding transcriptional regulator [Palleronia sp. LCG004]WOI58132.1 LacI family DNA-binding transcriptional regulator [Palleronia sp. LCG004]